MEHCGQLIITIDHLGMNQYSPWTTMDGYGPLWTTIKHPTKDHYRPPSSKDHYALQWSTMVCYEPLWTTQITDHHWLPWAMVHDETL